MNTEKKTQENQYYSFYQGYDFFSFLYLGQCPCVKSTKENTKKNINKKKTTESENDIENNPIRIDFLFTGIRI